MSDINGLSTKQRSCPMNALERGGAVNPATIASGGPGGKIEVAARGWGSRLPIIPFFHSIFLHCNLVMFSRLLRRWFGFRCLLECCGGRIGFANGDGGICWRCCDCGREIA